MIKLKLKLKFNNKNKIKIFANFYLQKLNFFLSSSLEEGKEQILVSSRELISKIFDSMKIEQNKNQISRIKNRVESRTMILEFESNEGFFNNCKRN